MPCWQTVVSKMHQNAFPKCPAGKPLFPKVHQNAEKMHKQCNKNAFKFYRAAGIRNLIFFAVSQAKCEKCISSPAPRILGKYILVSFFLGKCKKMRFPSFDAFLLVFCMCFVFAVFFAFLYV